MIAASIKTIESQAREAWLSGVGTNPYPCGSDAFRVWANAFAARYFMGVA